MLNKKIKVTTTSNFENIEIIDYLEPISVNVVVGMNIFKDMLSGLTDIFGGNSNSYQNVLTSINEEAIQKLRNKAHSIGANCVLGLKIDTDEISAQGKSMMMVTAIGTAAIADFSKKQQEYEITKKPNSISSNLYEILLKKDNYLEEAKNNKLLFNEEFWDFVKQQKVSELGTFIINYFETSIIKYNGYQQETLNNIKTHVIEYFSSIENTIASKIIYDKLNTELDKVVIRKICDLLVKVDSVDYEKTLLLFESSNFQTQKIAIKTSSYHKSNYEKKDIETLEKISKIVSSIFTEKGNRSKKKKKFSSKEIEIWNCSCGYENNENETYCGNCKQDIYGFEKDEITPVEIVEKINMKINILKRTIN